MSYDTQAYFTVRGSYDERRAALAAMSREQLEDTILDGVYNDFLDGCADYGEQDEDPHGHGKRLPYIGWYWRFVRFSDLRRIPVGDCGDFVGFMENNKWDYPERNLTEDEARRVIAFIDEAITAYRQGGQLSELLKARDKCLAALWEYMQTLQVAPR